MSSTDKSFLRSYLPSHIRNPFKLIFRLLTSGSAEARFALISAIVGIVVAPIDIFLTLFERKRYAKNANLKYPLVFVCGPPRSGTTLTEQVLLNNLPLAYFNNLTSWFPRSPLTAMNLFGRWLPKRSVDYKAFYGKTRYLSGPNDALYLWDRWVGKNRDKVPDNLLPGADVEIQQFFTAAMDLFQSPVLNKNNRLNTYAHLLANDLPNAVFICLRRDPLMQAQSLLIARKEIIGSVDQPYGIDSDERPHNSDGDYLDDICQQVLYYEQAATQQQKLIGEKRFWIIDYEAFCLDPQQLVRRVAAEVLQCTVNEEQLLSLAPFRISNKVRIAEDEFAALQKRLELYLAK